ncbi:MAG: SufD family Fe-S cluster assembly protein [Alphaproteobacteria bacterium]|nr:SufD family Fe-S cluster assembly protein [Alphaproteobacteria bacterium]
MDEKIISQTLPAAKDEAWRFTPIARLLNAQVSQGIIAGRQDRDGRTTQNYAPIIAAAKMPNCAHIVVVNGEVTEPKTAQSAIHTLDGTKFTPMMGETNLARRILSEISHFTKISLGSGETAPKPIQIIHIMSTGSGHYTPSLLLIELGDSAQAEIIETWIDASVEIGELPSWRNHLTLLSLGQQAILKQFRHDYRWRGQKLRPMRESHDFMTTSTYAHVSEQATWHLHDIILAGDTGHVTAKSSAFSRSDVKVKLAGEAAEFTLDAAHILQDHHPYSLATQIFHDAPQTKSRQTVKNIVQDQAHMVMQGLIQVAPKGQKTNAHLLAQGMILPPNSVGVATGGKTGADTTTGQILFKPELKIYADDVKCSHGATLGALDEQALFYLATRGLPPDQARAMLLSAFIAECFDGLDEFALAGLGETVKNWATDFLAHNDKTRLRNPAQPSSEA